MKTRNAILTFSLAALAFGAAAGLAMHHANAVETRAEPAATTRLYLDMSGFTDWYKDNASFKVDTSNDAKGDKTFAATKVGDAYYYADVDLETYASGGKYRFTRYSDDGSTEWNSGAWCSYAGGVRTYYVATDWAAGDWSIKDQETWQVVGASSGTWTEETQDINLNLTMRFNDEGLCYYSTEISLTAGSVFKVSNGTTYCGYDKIETGAGSVIAAGDVARADESPDPNIRVVKSGTYEVYMKPVSGMFWMQETSESVAKNFATSFLSATNAVCVTEGYNNGDALKAIWNPKNEPDGTSLCEKWDALTIGAKNAFKTSGDATIVSARARYLFLIGKYNVLTQFSDGPAAARHSVGLTETNNTLLVVSIVSALTVVTVAGLFLFKKKKSIR